jgi:hypothetical protein
VGRDRVRIVLVAMAHGGKWVRGRFLVTVSGRTLAEWCPPEYGRRTVRAALDLLDGAGVIRPDGRRSQGARTTWEVIVPAGMRPPAGQQLGGGLGGELGGELGGGLGGGLGGDARPQAGAEAEAEAGGKRGAAALGPAPLGDLDASPSPSTSTTDTTAYPDPGCPDHGWADPGRPCGGCADARKRRDAATARDAAEQAEQDAAEQTHYAELVVAAGACPHGVPGGDVMRPGRLGPACPSCRLAWRESTSRVPADRRRAAEPDQLDAEPTDPPAAVGAVLARLAGGRP